MNFKRHKPKEHAWSTCGTASCRYDMAHGNFNGVNRYPGMYWKKMGNPRYILKNVKEYERVVDLPS